MNLKSFRVRNFRSVNDSGDIEVRQRTALVGRNESGKTNLLLALAGLNPPGEMPEMTFVKDFPRDRLQSEFSEDETFLWTTWELDEGERRGLAEIFPRAGGLREVRITRSYAPERYARFVDLPVLAVDADLVEENLAVLRRSVSGSLRGKGEDDSATLKGAMDDLSGALGQTDDPGAWARSVEGATDAFRNAAGAVAPGVLEKNGERLDALEGHAGDIIGDGEAHRAARGWALGRLPVLVYLDEYARVEGHQDVPAYLDRHARGVPEPADENFSKLVKVAGLDPERLNDLLSQEPEERQLLANRASSVVTAKMRELWTERSLSVRFNLDGRHFDTLISDPNALFPVEVNLDERSRGFKWFFSFYMTFAADTAGGPAEYAVLLLDEPGLYLHAMAQRDLLDHFKKDFGNQILYTTHSPFMIPTEDIASVRTVNIAPEEGTTVTNAPTGDHRTLFPLQAALGYDLTQTLFVGERNLIVEGVSDYWYLSAVSEHLAERGDDSGLPAGMVLTPSGGAQKVSYMVALLAAQNLKIVVLFDDEPKARNAAEELLKNKLVREENLVFATAAFDGDRSGGADIEDLLDPETFGALVEESYARELDGKSLDLNDRIPRVVKRYEEAFRALGMDFHKTRPAKLFLRKMAASPEEVLTGETEERFRRLFGVVAEKAERVERGDGRPFR